MLEREAVEDGLEDGKLGLEGGEVRGAEVCAMSGVGLGCLCAVCEGAEADAAAGGHDVDIARVYTYMACWNGR